MRPVTIACDAVLFDMDGTLVDSRRIVERMWLLWAAEHDIAPDAVLEVAHGRRTLETMEIVAPHLATQDEADRLDAREAEQDGGEVAVSGAAVLLAALPPDRWAVVTSARRGLAARRIERVGLPVPAVLIGADEVRRGKPDPEGYLMAAAALGRAPARCVVLEDTPPGIGAARAAGTRVIGVLTTHSRLEGCDLLVQDLRSIQASTKQSGAIELMVQPA